MREEMSYKDVQSSQWALGKTASTLSDISDLSDSARRTWTPFGLHIIPKEVEASDRTTLQTTTEDLLCFFRIYVSTIAKTQMISMIEGDINRFFWYHIQNLIFYSLPHGFVQVFIAAYAPDDHLYLDKMNPLLYGYNFVVIFAAFFELLRLVCSNMFLMDYLWIGLSEKNPWNRCSDIYRTKTKVLKTVFKVECYDKENFTKTIKQGLQNNKSLFFNHYEYYLEDTAGKIECFQIPHMRHFRIRWLVRRLPLQETPFGVYFLLLWGLAALHYNQFFKNRIWKILKFAHYSDIAIRLVITVQVFLSYNVMHPELKNVNVIKVQQTQFIFPKLDIGLIIAALSAPPVAHVLISRSTNDHNKIQCKSLSAVIVASGWLYNFFNGITFRYVKSYCESLVGVKLHSSRNGAQAFYYVYAVYFSYFLLGNVYFGILILAKLLSDFYLFIITYHCLVETIVCEWKFVTRIMMISFITLMALLTNLLIGDIAITVVYLYSKTIAILIEIIGIYILYPLGRLIEDIIFQTGNEPDIIQKWCLRIVPVFVGFKIYSLLNMFKKYQKYIYWCWYLPIVVLIAGVIYSMFILLFIQRRSWHSLFCPISEWGPPDYFKRRCRKMYKQHKYIGSQADRELSQCMLSRDKIDVVRLDVKYDVGRRSTKTQYYNTESDKKTL